MLPIFSIWNGEQGVELPPLIFVTVEITVPDTVNPFFSVTVGYKTLKVFCVVVYGYLKLYGLGTVIFVEVKEFEVGDMVDVPEYNTGVYTVVALPGSAVVLLTDINNGTSIVIPSGNGGLTFNS